MKMVRTYPQSTRKTITAILLCLCFLFSIQPAPAEVSVGTDNGREAIDINAET